MEENNQFNNIQNNQQNVEKNEKRGRGLFYFIVAFAIVIISVVGATYAYFTATATTGADNAITAGSTSLTLGIETDSSGIKNALIPASEYIAKYAYAEQDKVTYEQKICKEYAFESDGETPIYELEDNGEQKKDDQGNPIQKCLVLQPDPNSTCLDDSGSDVCSYYTYSVINNNASAQTLTMSLTIDNNEFQNLWFMVYTDVEEYDLETETTKTVRTRITDPKPIKNSQSISNEEDKSIEFTIRADKAEDQEFQKLVKPTLQQQNSRVTYTIVLFIKELKDDGDPSNNDQTAVDGNKTFRGWVDIISGDGKDGVTGTIAMANQGETKYDDVEPTSKSEIPLE